MDEFKVRTPASIVVAGPSGAGKTHLIEEMIQRLDEIFDRPPTQIIFCYARYQPTYDKIKKGSPIPIEFVEGLDGLRPKPRTLLILDDLQDQSKLIEEYFTRHIHHSDLVCVYVTQNLFLKTPHHRTCSLNSHILVVFKNPRDKLQISCLAKQIYPQNNKFLMDAYDQATTRPHGYLVINLQQKTNDLYRVRDSFFPKEAHFFTDKKTFTKTDLNTL